MAFAVQSHTETKHVLSRLSLTISDTAIRDAFTSIAQSDRLLMRERIRKGVSEGELPNTTHRPNGLPRPFYRLDLSEMFLI
jgi:hypothetical protein